MSLPDPQPSQNPVRVRHFAGLTRSLEALRQRSSRVPLLGRLTGGGDSTPDIAIAQGLLASVMVMVGSWGVGWIPSSQESVLARSRFLLPLRVEMLGVITCTLLLALGSMLLFRAWLRLRQRAQEANGNPVLAITKAIWAWSIPLLFSFPILSKDVYSYLGQGRLMHAGLSPYTDWVSQLPGWFAQGSDSLWAESTSPYGPLFLMYARFVYFVSGGVPEYGVLLMRLVAVAGVLLCAYAVVGLAKATGRDAAWPLWISVANPLFLLNMIGGVHNDGLMIGGVLLGFLLVARKRRFAGVLVATAAIAIKPIVVLVLPFLGLAMLSRTASNTQKLRAWLFTGSVALGVMALLGWAYGRRGFGGLPLRACRVAGHVRWLDRLPGRRRPRTHCRGSLHGIPSGLVGHRLLAGHPPPGRASVALRRVRTGNRRRVGTHHPALVPFVADPVLRNFPQVPGEPGACAVHPVPAGAALRGG